MSNFTLALRKDEKTGEPLKRTMGGRVESIENQYGIAVRIPAEPTVEKDRD